jgi:thiamine kinase-like enzyme
MRPSQEVKPARVAAGDIATEDVVAVLRAAFGDLPIEELSMLQGGRSSATLYAFVVQGESFVLRRPDPARPLHYVRSERQVACSRIAAARGIAPALRHVDAATGITIEARIDGAPFRRGAPGATQRIAQALRVLHEGPVFPSSKMSSLDLVRYLDGEARARSANGAGLPASLIQTVAEVSRATARFAETAPCHNDLNPGNILDASGRIYFIDWDTACAGDPFIDLAQLGVFSFSTPDARAELLEAYLGRTPSETERARATLARVMALAFYAAAFMASTAAAGGSLDVEVPPLPLPELLPKLGRGEAGPALVAASLHREMQAEQALETFAAAMRLFGGP